MVDDTRLEPAGAGAQRPASAVLSARFARSNRSQVRVRKLTQKEQPPCWVAVLFGGRYKTRTCDLPHVKRMRYQLRQSSISLDRIHPIVTFVKTFLTQRMDPPGKSSKKIICDILQLNTGANTFSGGEREKRGPRLGPRFSCVRNPRADCGGMTLQTSLRTSLWLAKNRARAPGPT